MSGFSLAALKNTLDEVRVQVYAKNETEKKVYEALSSKNWGASSTMLNDIANDTSDYEKFGIINDIVWASLDTEGKSWKQIFKSLTLIEFLIKNGSERFIEAARDKLFKIKRLQDYNFYEGTVDKGSGCREKAKQIVELLSSNEIIRAEREKARALRHKFGGVGSDSRGMGGGGYSGSYGGSYGGSSDSYGNQGIDSRDRPSAGSGGRYGNDSYGGSNSYSDRGSSNSYSSNNHSNNTGRYGGGAYDSDKPPRYGDDVPSERYDSGNVGRRSSTYDRDEPEVDDIKPYKPKSKDTNTATGGKLKVSIRKSDAPAATAPAPAPVKEVNLIGDDFDAFDSAPAPTSAAAPAAAAFDPFGMSAPAPAVPAPAPAAFDPFGMSAPAPAAPVAAAFDPFNAPAPVTYTPAPAPAATAFDPFNQPQYAQPQPSFPPQQYHQSFQPAPQQSFQQQPQFQAAPVPTQQPQYRANPPSAAAPADNDFGDFEGAKPAAPAKPAATNKWGDLGNLVDLSGISKNQPVMSKNDTNAAANAAYANSSFAGLDGFNKTPQNMQQSAGRPMGGYGASSMGQPAMVPRGPPMGHAPMGQPMGHAPMGQSMGQPMGGGMAGGPYGAAAPMPMGGYGGGPAGYGAPAPAMGMNMGGGYGGPQQGGFGGPAPMMGAPGYGAPAMGGAPTYGAPMGYRPNPGPGGFGGF